MFIQKYGLHQTNAFYVSETLLDDEGRIYIIYPIAEIAEILDKGSTTIKGALNELDMAGLLERERGGFSAPNRLYVKVPRVPQVQFSDQLMAGNPTLTMVGWSIIG